MSFSNSSTTTAPATSYLLTPPTTNQYVLYPIQHMDMWEKYKTAQAVYWTAEEVDLTRDITDWEKMSDQERWFIKHVLAFFAASDGIVNENLGQRFLREVQVQEAKSFYAFQIAMENVHAETYALLIDTLIKEPQEKARLFDATNQIPTIQKKAEWALRWIDSTDASFAQRLLAFACVEGIFFSGSFCSIYWLKERGLMPGLAFSNELISRDEALHTEFAVLLYTKYTAQEEKLPQALVHDMIREAVALETSFINEAIPCSIMGMNADMMDRYIKFVSDRLLTQLGYDKLWNAKNPFPFMERISLENKTNFFEKRVAEYSLFAKKNNDYETTFGGQNDVDF
jgi:ribonucleoside-diphosphate reductase beta chain